jgi:hypothetical protein
MQKLGVQFDQTAANKSLKTTDLQLFIVLKKSSIFIKNILIQ